MCDLDVIEQLCGIIERLASLCNTLVEQSGMSEAADELDELLGAYEETTGDRL